MAEFTTHLSIEKMIIGQKEKETTFNLAMDKIDAAVFAKGGWLGELASDPTPTAALVGSRYWNTTSSVFRTLRNSTTWVNG